MIEATTNGTIMPQRKYQAIWGRTDICGAEMLNLRSTPRHISG